MSLHSVIMAGGSGTRFWPLSRRVTPKQLLAITSDRTMIRETAERLVSLTPFATQWVVCGTVHADAVRKELPELPRSHILVEPVGRNTAPCIGLACIHLLREDPDAVVCVLPSDAHVSDAADFCRHLARAEAAAKAGFITTLGIRPSRPETGYGYIQTGKSLEVGAGMAVHRVERFVEKPDLATAQKYLASGDYLWNAGIFVFSARQMLAAMQKHMPELYTSLMALGENIGTPGYDARLAELYPRMPSQSIDYGVMEKEKDLAVVPSTFGWSDVGSFAALPEVLGVDEHGNLVRGTALLDGCRDCVVDSRAGRLVAGVGLGGLMVIDTKDALLVIPKDRAQDVKTVLEQLKKKGREDLL
ncbi:MAG: mannose-1-phosphate guanylyltransferase [Myxococcota bacterium]